MKRETLKIGLNDVPLITTKVAIVGTGAAALNAAVRLSQMGVEELLIVTEKIGAGTSANAGSDKQTYYRLNPASDVDSVSEMAQDLFSGSCMHGDIALVEAALSQRSFYHLVEIGVPFPQSRYGEHLGFQTDHDTKSRGTSAGPKTSILMVEKLLNQLRKSNIEILEECTVIDLLTGEKENHHNIAGLLVLENGKPLIIRSDYVVYGTGGPGALYFNTVYPHSQLGSLGIAIKAGVAAQNLTESQFGIASVGFRWNLSGSYQQVLPRYISTWSDGSELVEFLNPCFPTIEKQLEAQFLKGYEWPFDVRKINNHGSSLVDLLVYNESVVKGRKVYLDFRQNPLQVNLDYNSLPPVVKRYLENSKAVASSPVKRLQKMNLPAYELFKENGIDLEKEPLEIAICHQHCNGGLIGSIWWESKLAGFFPVGECNGTHGVYRPGGSALNSGQCGSLRAAEMIHYRVQTEKTYPVDQFCSSTIKQISKRLKEIDSLTGRKKRIDPVVEREKIQKRMSSTLGIVRSKAGIQAAMTQNQIMQQEHKQAGVKSQDQILAFFKNEDLLITEQAFLESTDVLMKSLKNGRGSYLIGESTDLFDFLIINKQPLIGVPDQSLDQQLVQYQMDESGKTKTWLEAVRPIPQSENWFEQVWKDFRENKHFENESAGDHE